MTATTSVGCIAAVVLSRRAFPFMTRLNRLASTNFCDRESSLCRVCRRRRSGRSDASHVRFHQHRKVADIAPSSLLTHIDRLSVPFALLILLGDELRRHFVRAENAFVLKWLTW